MDTNEKWIPLLVLRDMILMPGVSLNLDIKNNSSVSGVNAAITENTELFVVAAKNEPIKSEVTMTNIHSVGTLIHVKQMLKLPGGVLRILADVKCRAKILALKKDGVFYRVIADTMEPDESLSDHNEETARVRIIKDLCRQCNEFKLFGEDRKYDNLMIINDLSRLIDVTASTDIVNFSKKQEILETEDLQKRSDIIITLLQKELSVANIRKELNDKLKDCVNKNQREYVLREQMKLIRRELGDADTEEEADRYYEMLAKAAPPEEVREKLHKEIKRFGNLSYSSSESAVLRNYIETLLEYPWNTESEENNDLNKIIDKLEKDHYGLNKIKEKITDYMAVRLLSGRKDAPILCLVGPPGTGKTSIARSIADALNRKYVRIALGGVRDEAEIRGHRKTYIGAMPGRIVSSISKSETNNPLVLLDEIDKTGSDYKGAVASALLEVLDGEQNVYFTDHYFEVPVDLSKVLFVATANDASQIPQALSDRMEIIEVNSYTEKEKFHIASLYLLPKQLKKNGLKRRQFKISDEAIYELIHHYTKEAGVRKLEQLISTLMQKAARGILTGEYKSLNVTPKKLPGLLGVWKYNKDDSDYKAKVGTVNGLAWTRVGGELLKVEANILDGKDILKLTGNLGDVMKESGEIALSFIRTLPEIKKLPEDYFEKHMVHLHVPEGATPKDGPSAGITMALAMYSALLNREVDGTIAMTGEITLKGNVLPIGGLKEKLLAAGNAGMKRVIVPEKNRRNVAEIEDEITDGLEIIYVSSMSEVIETAVVKRTFSLRA